MNRSKALYVAAAPVLLLILLVAGLRAVPALRGEAGDGGVETEPMTFDPAGPLQPVSPDLQRKLESTLQGQLSAIHKRDFQQALLFSIPDYRKVQSPDSFRNMIESGYLPLETATKYRFAPGAANSRMATVMTTLISPSGLKSYYQYVLLKTNSGWLVTSCVSVPTPTSDPNGLLHPPSPR